MCFTQFLVTGWSQDTNIPQNINRNQTLASEGIVPRILLEKLNLKFIFHRKMAKDWFSHKRLFLSNCSHSGGETIFK